MSKLLVQLSFRKAHTGPARDPHLPHKQYQPLRPRQALCEANLLDNERCDVWALLCLVRPPNLLRCHCIYALAAASLVQLLFFYSFFVG